MSYVYSEQRSELFTERGVEILLKVRANVRRALKVAGAVRAEEAISGVTGLNWTQFAALDYMVEKGEIREISEPGCAGQHRVFVSAS